jgi:glycosyltransferase involved in cell wall biosynthesis
VSKHILLKLEEPLGEQTYVGEEIPFKFWILDPEKQEKISEDSYAFEILYQQVGLNLGPSYLGTSEEIIIFSNRKELNNSTGLQVKKLIFDSCSTYESEHEGIHGPILEVSGQIHRETAFQGTISLKIRVSEGDLTVTSNSVSITIGDKANFQDKILGGPFRNLPERYFGQALILRGWAFQFGSSIKSVTALVDGVSSVSVRYGLSAPELAKSLPDLVEVRDVGIELVCLFPEHLVDEIISVNLEVEFSSGHKQVYYWGSTLVSTSLRKAFILKGVQDIGRWAKLRAVAFSDRNEPMRVFLRGTRKLREISLDYVTKESLDRENLELDCSYYSSYPPYDLSTSLPLDFLGRTPGSVSMDVVQGGKRVKIISRFLKEKLSLLFNSNIYLSDKNILKSLYRIIGGKAWLPVNELNLSPELVSDLSEKVLFVSHNLSFTEGAPRVLYAIIEGLRPHISQSILLSLREGEAKKKIGPFLDRIEIIPELSQVEFVIEKYFKGIDKLVAFLESENPRKVIVNGLDSFPVVAQAIDGGLNTVWIIHESIDPAKWFEHLPIYLRHRFLFALKNVQEIIFVSSKTKELYVRFLGKGKALVINNGIDIEAFSSSVKSIDRDVVRTECLVKKDEFVFLTVGTTTERKGQDRTIRELALFRKLNPEIKFKMFFVGAREIPDLFRLRQLVEGFDMEDVVTFVPETSDVAKYYGVADCFIINSREESSPLVVLEAYAAKLPVLSTTVFGLKDLVENEVTGLTFDGDKEGELAGLLLKIVKERELRDRLAQRGFEFVKENYSLERMIEGYRELL